MAVQYCTATNYGKDFFTHAERSKMSLIGYPGNVWVVDGGSNGDAWITKVSGVAKSKADAQALVDTEVAAAQAAWDGLTEEERHHQSRPEAMPLPGLG